MRLSTIYILAFVPDDSDVKKIVFDQVFDTFREHAHLKVIQAQQLDSITQYLKINPRIGAVLYDFSIGRTEFCDQVQSINPDLPIFAFTDNDAYLEVDLKTLKYNLQFLNYKADQSDVIYNRIISTIEEYVDELFPPFTKALFDYASKNKYSYSTPGHADGNAFLSSPLGTLFYDFFGPNIFKSDISISMDELGSLLDHSGKHFEAEEYMAKIYGSDKCYIVTNGTSTSNKIISMHIAYDGACVIIDRNCHKSLTHALMMTNVYPIYLRPTRNKNGIIGGISKEQFTKPSIEKKLKQLSTHFNRDFEKPIYTVITNSTYDGIVYDVNAILNVLPTTNVHFDAAWIPYAPFSPIYKGHYGLSGNNAANQTIYESFSTHKMLAAFSQSAMIHVKGNNFDEALFNDSYMMHSSTSPFYPLVASTETAVGMMRGGHGVKLMESALQESFTFRREIQRLREENESLAEGWFYDILQPPHISQDIKCFKLKSGESWHGFKGDVGHLSLDPIKMTLLTPGLINDDYSDFGIPAAILAKFLDYQGIVVEKTGPYSLLFLFGIGSDRAKSLKLLNELASFKKAFDDNLRIEKILPNLYAEAPRFYKKLTIQQLAEKMHSRYIAHDICGKLFTAYEILPEMTITPYQARQKIIKNQITAVGLDNLVDKVVAEMILPYPPGIPLLIPGEKITSDSIAILDFLKTLIQIGDEFPGFETKIHGITYNDSGTPISHCVIED